MRWKPLKGSEERGKDLPYLTTAVMLRIECGGMAEENRLWDGDLNADSFFGGKVLTTPVRM